MTSTSTVLRASDPMLARTIPSLDGIRALAVVCVIWGHGAATLPQSELVVALRAYLPGGYFGVQAFFVLSGFLITTLLLRERSKTGRISLSGFYRRRAYRILPALFVFLAIVTVLALTGVISGVGPRDIISPALFLRDYWPLDGAWWTGHTWSLSVEEQFYVLWPLAVILMPRAVAVKVLVAGVLLSPVIRVGTSLLPFVPEGAVTYMFHTRADALMIGCLLAYGAGQNWYARILEWIFARRLQWAVVVWLPVSWALTSRFEGLWMYTVGYVGDALAVAIVIVWMMRSPGSPFGRFLNWRPVVHVGLISYSLYLYQQLFLTNHNDTWFGGLTIGGLLALLLAAEASYWFVERPFIRLRVRRERAKTTRRAASRRGDGHSS
ncbi:acyltransferase [Microbacterium oleivorans]|uniref:acyltransferase family protein n=1 Tax=Microbacterium oleivorans TaxID=273677 RepID=UPI0010A35457|nr:acyltransferase [Microbacterium oleivorans]THE06775.1 acyltransferase [Microbacterium oleivorans]